MIKSSLINKLVVTEKKSIEEVLSTKGNVFSYLNPVSYINALDNKALFDDIDGLFADGSILVNAIKALYGVQITRRSFDMTSMAPQLFNYANENKKSVCIVSTHQDKLEKAVTLLTKKYPNIDWKGCRNGYFTNEEEMDEAAKIVAQNDTDFLIVGMGAVLQEKFLIKCKKAGYQGIGFTCGGFIHQISETLNPIYYPEWVNKYNLRFFYRMYKEPYTRARYFKAAFVFPYRFLKERLS